MAGEANKLGGVRYGEYVDRMAEVKSAEKLKNGNYRITYKDGSTFTYKEQQRGAIYNNYRSHYQISGVRDAHFKNSKDSKAMSIRASFLQNTSIDVSNNNKADWISVSTHDNLTIKLDENDHACIRVYGKDCSAKIDCKGKGTYDLRVPDECVKRNDVPQVLLSQYDAIAKKSKSNTINTKEQTEEFKKAVQEAFDKKQITKEEAEKMGFNSHSVYEHFKYTQKFAATCTKPIEDKMTNKYRAENLADIGLGFVGAGVMLVSGAAGLFVDGWREQYDLISGKMGQQTVFTHWATDGDIIQAKPKESK